MTDEQEKSIIEKLQTLIDLISMSAVKSSITDEERTTLERREYESRLIGVEVQELQHEAVRLFAQKQIDELTKTRLVP